MKGTSVLYIENIWVELEADEIRAQAVTVNEPPSVILLDRPEGNGTVRNCVFAVNLTKLV